MPEGARPNPRYFFWSGNGLPKSAVADWQRSFRRLFKLAALENPDGSAKRCFPHMLRDTFAVEMLLAGVPIDQVSMLLGHSSVKITEKHYSPWVKARQGSVGRKRPQCLGHVPGGSADPVDAPQKPEFCVSKLGGGYAKSPADDAPEINTLLEAILRL